MRSTLIFMFKRFAHVARVSRWVVAFIAVCVLVGAVALYQMYRAAEGAVDRFTAYERAATEQQDAAFLVGSVDNPVRQELNLILSEVLQKNMTTSARLKRAQDGLVLLKEAELQIDTIGEIGAQVDTAIAQMQVGALGDFASSAIAREVLVLAKQRSAIIADIRGLSYRANFETKKIFDRIIEDGGKMTSAHIVALNDAIPDVEEQFDRRSDLYLELQRTGKQIDQKAVDLGGVWKGTW